MIQDVQDLLRTTLANCAEVRSFLGQGTVEGAAARIHNDYWPRPSGDVYVEGDAEVIWPAILIYTQPESGWSIERDSMGNTSNWKAYGELVCIFQQQYPVFEGFPEPFIRQMDVDFRSTIGDIIEELISKSETAGYLAATGFTVSGPFRTPEEDRSGGDWFAMEVIIRWGIR